MRFTASAGFTCLLFILSTTIQAQNTRAFNQNASRSNHTRLSFSITPVLTSPPVDGNNDTLSFRSSGGGLRIGADYYFGHVGISFTSGFTSSGTSNDALKKFMQQNNMHADQVMVNKAKSQQAYLLLGPSFRYGNILALEGTIKGGLFFNNGGMTDIRQKNTGTSLYRNEAGEKNVSAGMSYGIRMSYNPASNWAFGLMAEYMHSKTTINNYDSRRRQQADVPVTSTLKTQDLVFGISLIYKIRKCDDNAPQTRAQNNNTVRSDRTDNAFRANNDSVPGAPQTRAQNNNTVRSNRTDNAYRINDDNGQDDQRPVKKIILVQADKDGDGIYETTITRKAASKLNINEEGEIEDLEQKAGVSTSRSNIPRSGAGKKMSANDDDPALQQKAGVSTSRSNIPRTSAGKMETNDSIPSPEQRAGVSTSRSNIPRASHGKLQTNNDDDPAPQQKAGVSTSRSNIPRASHGKLMAAGDGPAVSYGTMIWKGKEILIRVIYE